MSNTRFLSVLAWGVVLAASGLYLGSQGDMFAGWLGVVFGVCTVFIAWANLTLLTSVDDVEVSAWGVRRSFGSRWARKVQAVSWDTLSEVQIVTNGLGPDAEDMFFHLHASDSEDVVVSGALAMKHKLLEELQKRLPGLDNRAVVEASGCTTDSRFLVWKRNSVEAVSG